MQEGFCQATTQFLPAFFCLVQGAVGTVKSFILYRFRILRCGKTDTDRDAFGQFNPAADVAWVDNGLAGPLGDELRLLLAHVRQ